MPKPLLSVLTACFNHGPLLPAGTHSLLGQTYQNWEQVIVNDGSTDQTGEILSSANDFRIHPVTHEKNEGTLKSYIDAIQESRGDIITFQDADDFSLPDRLEKIVGAFEDPKVDVVYHGLYGVSQHNSLPVDVWYYKGADAFSLPRLKKEQYISGATVAMRKSFAKKLVFNEGAKGCWDWYVLLQLAFLGARFSPLNEGLYVYRRYEGSQSDRNEQSGARQRSINFIRRYIRSSSRVGRGR